MGTLNIFKSLFAGNEAGETTYRACIVDVNALASNTPRDRVSPRTQIQLLQRLSRFAKKESVAVYAVLDGKELRAVSHGGDYQGVQVFFSEKSRDMQAAMLDTWTKGSRKGGALIVSDSAELETAVKARGGRTMRVSTLKKALDPASSGDGGQDSRGGNRRGGRRPQQDRRRRNDRNDRGKRREDGGSAQAGHDPVSELIDLVE